MLEHLLQEAHFWVGLALVVLFALLIWVGVLGMAAKALDARGAKIQGQLDEATRLRQEAEALLAGIKEQREEAEKVSAAMIANARDEAKRLQAEAKTKLADQISRRAALAERKIATAEAQATADVKAAAADMATQAAEQILAARIAGAKSDPLIDSALKSLGERLQ